MYFAPPTFFNPRAYWDANLLLSQRGHREMKKSASRYEPQGLLRASIMQSC